MGSAFYFIAGIGPVIMFGPLVSWIVRALEGAVMAGEWRALGAGLQSIGIAKHSIMEYETARQYDKLMVIAQGTPDDMAKANSVLENPGVAQIAPILLRCSGPAHANRRTSLSNGSKLGGPDARKQYHYTPTLGPITPTGVRPPRRLIRAHRQRQRAS